MIDWTRLTPAVERAAGIAKSNFPAHHDISDVKQELWVWIMSNKNTVTRVLSDQNATVNVVVPLLVKAANDFLKKEDAADYGYHQEDRFEYSLDLIKSILEVVFEHEDWQSFSQAASDGMPRAKSEPATSGDNLASYADVSRAIASLPEEQYNALVWRYKYHYTHQQIGDAMGFTRQRAQKILDNAVKAIQKALGERSLGDLRNGYDGRTADAVTRGHVGRGDTAQHIVDKDYEG